MSESEISAHQRVISKFDKSRNSLIGIGERPDEASRHALEQTLIPGNLDKAGIKLSDLTREVSARIAQDLIDVAEPRVREIVEEIQKGEYGDPAEQLDYSDERVRRILDSAERILNK